MDANTKTMVLTLASGAAKKGLITVGTALATHGWIAGSDVGTFVGIGMAGLPLAYSFWQDYGKAILLSQLEVLKAKSLAQAAKLSQAGLPPVTAGQIAAQSPTLSTEAVTKTIATLPPAVQATVSSAAAIVLAVVLASMFFTITDASAQAVKKATTATAAKCLIPFDPLGLCGALTGDPKTDLQRVAKRIAGIAKADLTYSIAKAKLASTNSSVVRVQCFQAISDANDQFNGVGLKNEDGSPMVRPNPAAVAAVEDLAELIDNLSPQGKLQTSCAGAAQMFKVDVLQAINGLVTGAASLVAVPAAAAAL